VRAGHAASNDDAFDRFLGREHPWYVASEKWPAVDVLRAVRDAGGVTALAHSVWYRDADALIRRLAENGLDALEVFHPDHGPEEEGRLGALARELDLAVTAGSDFHGVPEGRKHPGGVVGGAEMLGILRTRARRP
jgi:predicted metal-dependent phosphoesterase TrpH